ncbi:MAG TPA: holo-ACP synthase [Thermoleophilaceae bacterium]|nr:holo-ACP synthase [Thermoleophilaceae bacterium]
MIGIDLLEIGRLEAALERRPRLAARLFTEGELSYAAGKARPGQHLAARFCAKEAVAKALALESWAFRDVEVVSTSGAPEVRLTGAAAERARELGGAPRISLTHTEQTAGAVAIVAPARQPG